MEECGTTEGPVAGMFYRAAVMASALVSLGDIPAEQLTPQLLCDGLTDDDFDLIDAQISALKKADGIESRLSGYRTTVLALGKYGFTEPQIGAMTRAELDGYINALYRLHGKSPRSRHLNPIPPR
ncbi:hypothetical protein M5585_25765 [Serratia ureilytica]